jgi:RNA processing factor Prp31
MRKETETNTGIILRTGDQLTGTERREEMTERTKWYGYRSDGTLKVYKLLSANPTDLFDRLSEGKDGLEMEEGKALPDLRELMLNYGRSKLKESLGRDWKLVKIFNVYNSMDEIINLLFEKSMALGLIVGESEDPGELFQNMKNNEDHAISTIGELGSEMVSRKRELEKSLNEKAKEIFPNTSRIINPVLCAELLGHFQSLERLVNTPSSSIQMAGAEKSLFISKTRHIPNPKHGFLYKSHLISGSSPRDRGKISRRLSAKIALTLKADGIGRIMSQDEIDNILSKISNKN